MTAPVTRKPHAALRVAIIGAGVVGLACALELRRRGADVTVYDRGSELGGGATIRAAGMLGLAYEGAQETESPALFALMQRSAGAWSGFAREIEHLGGRPVEFSSQGTLACAVSDPDVERLKMLAQACQARGLAAKWLDQNEARAVEPALTDAVRAVVWLDGDKQVDAQKLLMRLGQAAGRLGVGTRMARSVDRIDVGDEFIAPDGDRFDRVLLATGAGMAVRFASRRGGAMETRLPPVIPVKGQMLALAPPVNPPRHVIRMRDIYVAPKARWLLAGATSERGRADAVVDRDVIDGLRARAAAIVQGLGEAAELAAWAGVRPATEDGLPMIGETAIPGVFAAVGHYRNGVLLAPGTAELIADMMLDGKVSLQAAAFSPQRFDNGLPARHSP